MVVTVLASLAAAFLNARAGVMQRRAAGQPDPKRLFHHKFIAEVTKNKLWIYGIGLQILAFLLQALALDNGSLVVVEPLLTTDLIFLFLILHRRFNVSVSLRGWLSVAMISVGLSGLIAIANPHGGHLRFDGINWLITGCLIALLVLVSALIMRNIKSHNWRAAIGGFAAALTFAMTAALTKLCVEQLTKSGIGTLFSGWELYALIITGIISLITIQSAYAAGPLTISQPVIEIFDPAVSVVIGILLFGDSLRHDPLSLAAEAASGLVLAGGIAMLASTKQLTAKDPLPAKV